MKLKISNFRFRLTLFFILLLISISSFSKDKILKGEKLNSKVEWSSKKLPYFSVHYPECWKSDDPLKSTDVPDGIVLVPTNKCPQQDQGLWKILFIAETYPPKSMNPVNLTPDRQKLDINGMTVWVSDKVNNRIDRRKNNEKVSEKIWTASFDCNKLPLQAKYIEPLESQNVRSNSDHILPEVFKTFLSGFNCSSVKMH